MEGTVQRPRGLDATGIADDLAPPATLSRGESPCLARGDRRRWARWRWAGIATLLLLSLSGLLPAARAENRRGGELRDADHSFPLLQ